MKFPPMGGGEEGQVDTGASVQSVPNRLVIHEFERSPPVFILDMDVIFAGCISHVLRTTLQFVLVPVTEVNAASTTPAPFPWSR